MAEAFALLVVVATLGCGNSPAVSPAATGTASAAPSTSITTSLGIYSGRPDPSWDLTDAQVAQVVNTIEALPVTAGTPPQGGLGYHGFTIVRRSPGQADETLVAYRGTVAPLGSGTRTYRVDQGRTVERLLLDLGRSTLNPTEVAAVEGDFAAAP